MQQLIENNVPELLVQRSTVAYCSQLHLRKHRSTLVLGRNLKFYEFRNKELLHHIDLRDTCLQQLSSELRAYSGPISPFLIREDVGDVSSDATSYSMLHAVEELPLSMGKYVWLGKHIYILLRCWQMLLVLQRPEEHAAGFQVVAQHDNLEDYRLVKGPIPHQAYVELHFVNGKRQRTNFQLPTSSDMVQTAPSGASSAAGFERLMQRVHGARAELQTQRAQTQQDFMRTLDQQAFGVPGQRSPLLEEKQLLRRCGDVWTRICGDSLVLGTVITNSASCNRPIEIHAIRPLLRLPTGRGLNYTHRLYELPVQPDGQQPEDYEELAQFWGCQQQHMSRFGHPPVTANGRLVPECSAVLLLRIQLRDLVLVEHIQLLATYKLRQQQGETLRQLQLASINVIALLDEPELHVPSFGAQTLHQDFLAVIMTQTSHCPLRLQFESVEQQQHFEEMLTTKLELIVTTIKDEEQKQQEKKNDSLLEDLNDFKFEHGSSSDDSISNTNSPRIKRIFYNPKSQLLLLHDEKDRRWDVYARNECELCLLLRRLFRDLLQLHCSISLLDLIEGDSLNPKQASIGIEYLLREELQAKSELLELEPRRAQLTAKAWKRAHQLEMECDHVVTAINYDI